ncbi:hypothetical protein NQ317_008715 [Molorchus minor]|uniref:Uncharacterized protein n=1 Tax=Molorchus minor TaxID=1323400 RepID=A0ABQ9JF79_9CUCU|nr:hypothetical protein NQ317_008715 [Molorchus minor]
MKDPILKTVTAPYGSNRHAALVLDESRIISPAENANIEWVQNLLVCPYCDILLPEEEIDTHIISNPNLGEKVELGITSLYSEVSGRPSNSQRTPSISFYLPTTSSKHMPLANLEF